MNPIYAPVREFTECSCGGGFVSTGYLTFGDTPSSGVVLPPYHLISQGPNYAANLYPRPACPHPSTPNQFVHSNDHISPRIFGNNHANNGNCFGGSIYRRPPSPPIYHHAIPSGSGFDPTVGGNSNGGRPSLDVLMGVGVQEGLSTVMPIRFVQVTPNNGDSTFELHCSSENLEKLKRLLREAEVRGRGRSLDGYLCPLERLPEDRI